MISYHRSTLDISALNAPRSSNGTLYYNKRTMLTAVPRLFLYAHM